MLINEIFYSIQGEGQWTGIPNIFIRTTGCNLRCNYCDTKYAYDKGEEIKIYNILGKVEEYPCKKICITGGEPLIQKKINELIKQLLDNNYEILVETNGSIDIEMVNDYKRTIFSLDIKCPSSKMNEKMYFDNIDKVSTKDQLKFVIKDRKDYDFAKNIIKKFNPKCKIYFQPVWKSNIQKLSEWILKDGLNVVLGLQIHKIIWGKKRGV